MINLKTHADYLQQSKLTQLYAQHQQLLKKIQIPTLKHEETSFYLGNAFFIHLSKYQQQNYSFFIILKCIAKTVFKTLVISLLFIFLEIILRLIQSQTFYWLLNGIQSSEQKNVYYYVFVMGAITLFSKIVINLSNTFSTNLSVILVNLISYIVYHKTSLLSSKSIKNDSYGKITNLITSDLNIINAISIGLYLAVFPFATMGFFIIVLSRFGWLQGLICIALFLFVMLAQTFLAKLTGKIMKKFYQTQDKRIKFIQETFSKIKEIKIYGWEAYFKKIIQKMRKKQERYCLLFYLTKSFQYSVSISSKFQVSFVCLFIFYLIDPQQLTTFKILSLIEVLQLFKSAIQKYSNGVSYSFQFKCIIVRLTDILNIKNENMIHINQINQPNYLKDQKQKEGDSLKIPLILNKNEQQYTFVNNKQIKNSQNYSVQINNVSCYAQKDDLSSSFLLNINISLQKGKFYGIVGKMNAGKTALINLIIQNIPYYSGKIKINGKISYVDQQPIIFNGSIKENILFGRCFNSQRFQEAIKYSYLSNDLQRFQNGDQTIIVQKGRNLSGGQKFRIALARSIYQDADIYVYDDVLSALDSKVSKQIFSYTFKQYLKNKTIILASYNISLIKSCDAVIIMNDKKISMMDQPDNLVKELSYLENVIMSQIQTENQGLKEIQLPNNNLFILNKKKSSFRYSSQLQHQKTFIKYKNPQKIKKQFQLNISWKVLFDYLIINKYSYLFIAISIYLFLGNQALALLYANLIINYQNYVDQNKPRPNYFHQIHQFWIELGFIMLIYFLCMVLKFIYVHYKLNDNHQFLYTKITQKLLSAQLQYFNQNSLGTIVNRYSNDMNVLFLDSSFALVNFFECFSLIIVVMIKFSSLSIIFIVIILIDLIAGIYIYLYFINVPIIFKNKQLKIKSKKIQQLSMLIHGITILNVYQQRLKSIQQYSKNVDEQGINNLLYKYTVRNGNYYISMLFSFSFIIALIFGTVFLIKTKQQINLFSIGILFLIQIDDQIQWMLRQISKIRGNLVSFLRLKAITQISSEKQNKCEQKNQNPQLNDIQMKNMNLNQPIVQIQHLNMAYQQFNHRALKDIKLKIYKGQKVGIIGRSGAGKSSILYAMLRLKQPFENSVYKIKGKDGLKMNLHDLRHTISIIPQDSFIFSGTIRQNLDPFYQYSDQKIEQILQIIQLKQLIDNISGKTSAQITDDCGIFSTGQKQLLNLGRVLLQNRNIIFLDEASSNLDRQADKLMNKVIKQRFVDKVVIKIAHRLKTIADCDKVIAMSEGRIVQQGIPLQLLEKNGLFQQMVNSCQTNDKDQIRKIAQKNYKKKMFQKINY